ncbi:hypothetical protein L9G16_01910 [Shewanella sp. A25]|nr:hypothetical protein [Shewanella shenzhenensis]
MYLPHRAWRFLAMMVLGVVSLSACVSDSDRELRTTVVMAGDLSQLPASAMTYSWHPKLQKIFVDSHFDEKAVSLQMQETLKKVLLTKGFRWVQDPQLADFQVGYGIALGKAMSDEQILAAAGLVPGLSSAGVDPKKYEKGSVLVSFFKRTGDSAQVTEQFWRVLAQGFANMRDRDELKAGFESLVDEMLLPIPVTHAAQ